MKRTCIPFKLRSIHDPSLGKKYDSRSLICAKRIGDFGPLTYTKGVSSLGLLINTQRTDDSISSNSRKRPGHSILPTGIKGTGAFAQLTRSNGIGTNADSFPTLKLDNKKRKAVVSSVASTRPPSRSLSDFQKHNINEFNTVYFPQAYSYYETHNGGLKSSTRMGNFYECLAADILNLWHGFKNLTKVGGSGDQGIDIVGKLPASVLPRPNKNDDGTLIMNELLDISVFAQCKCIKNQVKPADFQSFYGALQSIRYSQMACIEDGDTGEDIILQPTPTLGVYVSTLGLGAGATVHFRTSLIPMLSIVFKNPLINKILLPNNGTKTEIDCNLEIMANKEAVKLLQTYGYEIQKVYDGAQQFNVIAKASTRRL